MAIKGLNEKKKKDKTAKGKEPVSVSRCTPKGFTGDDVDKRELKQTVQRQSNCRGNISEIREYVNKLKKNLFLYRDIFL